jgi:hypothetical protein
VIDGLAVTFMFNAINRVANAYDLAPEWETLRRTDLIQTFTRRFMAFGLPLQMPLASDNIAITEPVHSPISSLLHHFGVDSVSPVWQQLHLLPRVEMAIHQLLRATLNYSRTDDRLLNAVTRECLISHANGNVVQAGEQSMPFWSQLYVEPYNASRSSFAVLPDERTKIDVTFRVALLAAIHKLNGNSARQLIEELWMETQHGVDPSGAVSG